MFLVKPKQMKLDRDAGVTIKDLCVKYGLCKASVYRILGSWLFLMSHLTSSGRFTHDCSN